MGKARELPVCPPAPAPPGSAESLQRDVRGSCSVLHQGKAPSLRPSGPCQRGSCPPAPRGGGLRRVLPRLILVEKTGSPSIFCPGGRRAAAGVGAPRLRGAPRAAPAAGGDAVPRAVSALRCPGTRRPGPALLAWLSTTRSFKGAPEPGPASRGVGCPPSPLATS